MRARKKPIEVEVVQYKNTEESKKECREFVGEAWIETVDTFFSSSPTCPGIKTLEGEMEVSEGDYIIKGVHGEYYPCKADIFKETYELAPQEMTLEELFNAMEDWSIDRNIHKGNPKEQLVKTLEELGEVANGLNKWRMDDVKDGIGDVVITLVSLAQRCDLSFEECLRSAFNEVKDRQGIIINGVFVKNSDLY